jgi:hypothetical protein
MSETATPSAPVLDANGDPVTLPENLAPSDEPRAFFAGRVPTPHCPHYMAASEAAAGFTRCERCH